MAEATVVGGVVGQACGRGVIWLGAGKGIGRRGIFFLKKEKVGWPAEIQPKLILRFLNSFFLFSFAFKFQFQSVFPIS